MTASYSFKHWQPALWFGLLLGLLLLVEHTVTTLPRFAQHPVLPVAVTFDLLVGLPGLFYLLIVRRYRLPVSSVGGAVGAGWALAHWLLPVAQQQPLHALWLFPGLLELSTLAFLAAKARRLMIHYRTAYRQEPHAWSSLQFAVRQVLGPVGGVLVAELDMLRYALLGWWATLETKPAATVFSIHRESGFVAIVTMLGLAVAVETGVVHLVASHWSMRLAYWLLAFDAYTLVLLLAHGQAVRLRPFLLTSDALYLRVGFVWQLAVARPEIVAIEPVRDNPAPAPDLLNVTKLLFTTPNLLLTFAQPVVVQGPYGIRRTVRQVAVYVDQPRHFMAVASSNSLWFLI